MTERFTVWVGGAEVNDYYLSEDKAEDLAQDFLDDGYDDVEIVEDGEFV